LAATTFHGHNEMRCVSHDAYVQINKGTRSWEVYCDVIENEQRVLPAINEANIHKLVRFIGWNNCVVRSCFKNQPFQQVVILLFIIYQK
jgi:hypothetical protein